MIVGATDTGSPTQQRLIARVGWRELVSPRYVAGATAHVARLIRRDPVLRTVFVTLLAIDVTLMMLHWYQELGLDVRYPIALVDVAKLNMIRHASYVTSFDLMKSAATVMFLAIAWIATRMAVYSLIALAYGVVILLATTVLHADLGAWTAHHTGLADVYPEMAEHMIEGLFLAIIGTALLASIALGVVRSSGIHSVFAVAMAVAIVVLGFFGGGVDLFHALIFFELRDYVRIIAFIEEAGEALAQTMGCVFAAAISRRCMGL